MELSFLGSFLTSGVPDLEVFLNVGSFLTFGTFRIVGHFLPGGSWLSSIIAPASGGENKTWPFNFNAH